MNIAYGMFGASIGIVVVALIMMVFGTEMMNGDAERDGRIIRGFVLLAVIAAVAGGTVGVFA